MRRFDSKALDAALDRERLVRELSWRQVAQAVGVSGSTITRTRAGRRREVDGMLAMISWLRLPVEHFVRDSAEQVV